MHVGFCMTSTFFPFCMCAFSRTVLFVCTVLRPCGLIDFGPSILLLDIPDSIHFPLVPHLFLSWVSKLLEPLLSLLPRCAVLCVLCVSNRSKDLLPRLRVLESCWCMDGDAGDKRLDEGRCGLATIGCWAPPAAAAIASTSRRYPFAFLNLGLPRDGVQKETLQEKQKKG